MKKFLIYMSIILAICLCISVYNVENLHKELKISENNKLVLLDTVHKYKVRDSLNAVEVSKLELTKKELEKYRTDDIALIKSLKAEKSALQQYITTNTSTKQEIIVQVKDSIIYVRDTVCSAKAFDYRSKWTDVDGYILSDSAYLHINNREQLLISQSYVKKKFWFIKLPIWLFGYKTEKVDVVSLNPNTQITGVEFIKIKN